MNPREINTTFEITTASMNQHIALAKSNVRANRPALLYVHFEAEALKCAAFIRLCNEARTIAKEYINAKFKSDREGSAE